MHRFRFAALVLFAGIATLLTACNGCMDQHNPRPDWQRFEQERKTATAEVAQLNEDGTLPGQGGSEAGGEVTLAAIQEKYQTFCVSCHGSAGAGDGPGGAALTPPPRDFTDASWQQSVTDERIANVIRDGGPAEGLSPLMAPWSSVLNDRETEAMVKLVRGFGEEQQ